MNVYDSERMVDALRSAGYEAVEEPTQADLLLLNTCHIRDKAVEKVYSELGRLRSDVENRRRAGQRVLVGVAGCVAQAEGAEIPHRQPMVDFVVGPQAYHRLPETIRSLEKGEGGQVLADFRVDEKFARLPARSSRVRPSVFLTIQEGCDKFCTFCVVPYTRGAEHSRPVSEVLDEADQLAGKGAVEITVLGQNVNAYGGADENGNAIGLAALLDKLSRIDGIERLRYTTSHPRDMDAGLIEAHARNGKLMPYLHLPVQSGSDAVLARMNRRHTAAEYLAVIDRVRAARPDMAVSSDFIVGFPGETEEDFEATLALVEQVRFAQAFSFCYSPRPGTPAARASDAVPRDIARMRLHRLQRLLEEQSAVFREACVGKVFPVLFERSGRAPGQIVGRSPHHVAVHCEAPRHWLGRVARVEARSTTANGLMGQIAEAA